MKNQIKDDNKIRHQSRNWIEYWEKGGQLSLYEYIEANKTVDSRSHKRKGE